MSNFQQQNSAEKRSRESAKVMEKYPDRVPVICERAPNGIFNFSEVPELDRSKYLVPADITVGQFFYVVRKRLQLGPELALFFFIGKTAMPRPAALMSEVYNQQRDSDGFLYITYSADNTYG
jgi:GABA(A) receptor-associated protein